MKLRKRLLVFWSMGSALMLPVVAFAQDIAGVKTVAEAAGVGTGTDLITIIGRIINIFLGLLGVIFLGLLLYAGFLWMTSGGNPETVEKAKQTIRNAVIGLVIIASAWAITAFVLSALTGATTETGGLSGEGITPGAHELRGATGGMHCITESYLPSRNATNVPRNTPIIITFKEAIDPASFIAGWTEALSASVTGLNSDTVKIFRTPAGAALASDKARVTITSDFKTVVIKPVPDSYLGSPTVNVGYTVSLKGGKNGVKKKDGSSAFVGSCSGGYSWQFEVSTVVDLTPPTVLSATPKEPGSYPRNVIVQLTFSKPVDPTAVSGRTPNLEVVAEIDKSKKLFVPGEFRISNQYQTVEFIPDVKCGVNACGRDVFCLPGKQTIRVTARAAHIDKDNKPQALLTTSGYDGVVDVVGNSLDGNGKDGAEGPDTDNYVWSFGTTDDLKLTPPRIERTIPGIGAGKNSNVPLDQSVQAIFDSVLQGSTVNTENVKLEPRGPDGKTPDTFWWSTRLKLLNTAGAEISSSAVGIASVAVKTALLIDHRPYLPSGTLPATLNYYNPSISSGVQDEYQNCFNPAGICAAGAGPNCCNGKPQGAECAFLP